jgi:hypothetical protein
MVKSLLGMMVLYFLLSLVLIVLGIVTGSLLRLVFPAVDRGMSILIGEVAAIASFYLLTRIMLSVPAIRVSESEEDEEEDGEDEEEEEEPPARPPIWPLPPPERPSWRRRRRRR